MNALTPVSDSAAAIVERVVINGDLSKLTPQERVSYYNEVCTSVGLNPLTKPFEYINLNGKLTLYALRACTDQLRSIYGVSVSDLTETEREGVFIVTAKVVNKEGRTDIAKGAVNIAGLKGEALANAMMKAETKAKRRATLSVCGLGWLDESEVDSIPGAVKGEAASAPMPPPAPKPSQPVIEPPAAPVMSAKEWTSKAIERIQSAASFDALTDIETRWESNLARLKDNEPELFTEIMSAISLRAEQLG